VIANERQQWIEIYLAAIDPEQADEQQEQAERQHVLKLGAEHHNEREQVRGDVSGQLCVPRLDLVDGCLERAALSAIQMNSRNAPADTAASPTESQNSRVDLWNERTARISQAGEYELRNSANANHRLGTGRSYAYLPADPTPMPTAS
jgi:hypothetical protein